MTILILQDHTQFIGRMLAQAANHTHGHPLNITALEAIRRKMLVAKYRGELRTLGGLQDLANLAAPGAETEAIARAMALAVEADVEGWYCIADNEGVAWLENNHSGPVLRWGGGVWWGKLKGIQIAAEVKRHDDYKQPTRKRSRPGQREVETGAPEWPAGTGSSGLRRADVQSIE